MEKYTPDLQTHLMACETSIRTRLACPGGGTIVTLGFPGLAFDGRGETYIDRERLEATLSPEALPECALLIALVETAEVPAEGWQLLADTAAQQAMRLLHLPIRDYEAPDGDFLRGWADLAPEIAALLDAGRTVALCCHYGAGRSGTMAAALLMDRGLTAPEAVAAVRSRFADSIESTRQMDWLLSR